MTAITQIINYTVRCPHYQDQSTEATWRNHIEINHSAEIALDRLSKWHAHSGNRVFCFQNIVVRKVEKEEAYFAMISERLKPSGHALVTLKVFMDKCTKDTSVEEIVEHIYQDCQARLESLG
ncbi:MAG: hypothetical protein SStaBPW_27030 [Shewanella algae]